MYENEEVSVLFSGGSDSTLAAAYLCEQYKKVHLLNYHHSGMSHSEKSLVNVIRLKQKFGQEKIVFKQIDIEDTFQRLYFNEYFNDLKTYGVFLAAGTCNICQLAMHVQTIIYNVKNKIEYACDGYKKEKDHMYVVMSEIGKKHLKELYQKFGINYYTPVYDILRTDWKLYELGITPKKNVKFPYELLSYSAQHSCYHGILTNAYLVGYYYPLHSSGSEQWVEYVKGKIDLAKKYIDNALSKDLI